MPARGVNTVARVTGRRGDLLSMFLKAKEDHPTSFHDGRVLGDLGRISKASIP